MNTEVSSKPGIILAVKDAKRREAYLSRLGEFAECTVLETLGGIPDLLRQGPYRGILIDISLNVKATHMERVKISDSLEMMPSGTLNFNAGRGEIKLLMPDARHGTAATLEEFAGLCATFQPEVLFSPGREALHMNALLSSSPDFGPNAERTFTMYVSGSGCFLFTADKTAYRQQDSVWIDFVGLAERKPVLGKVRWKCEWGASNSVPGIYVSFESMLQCQHEEIMSLLRLHD